MAGGPAAREGDMGWMVGGRSRRPILALIVVGAATVLVFGLPASSSASRAAQAAAGAARALSSPPAYVLKWGGQGNAAGQFLVPAGIAVDQAGDVYVDDSGNNRVQVFDKDGHFLRQWTGADTPDEQFKGPWGIALGEGTTNPNVYIVDRYDHCVDIFRADGTFVHSFGSSGSGQGEFSDPTSIAVGPSGDVYVLDGIEASTRIEVFNSTGQPLAQWGSSSTQLDQQVSGIAVDGHERIWVAGLERLQEFTASGELLGQWTSYPASNSSTIKSPIAPGAVTVDANGNVYVADTNDVLQVGGRILMFAAGGSPLTEWAARVADDAGNGYPQGVAAVSVGTSHVDVYVLDNANMCVKKFAGSIGPAPGSDHTPPVTVVHGVDKNWHNRPVTVTFTATDNPGGSGVAYTEFRLRDPYGFGWQKWQRGGAFVVPAAANHADDGEFRVQYRSVDNAGNAEKTREFKVLIDTTPPKVKIHPAHATIGGRAVISFQVTDNLSRQFRVMSATVTGPGTSSKLCHEAPESKWLMIKGLNGWGFTCDRQHFGKPGAYTIKMVVSDRAGNLSKPGTAELTVK